MSFIANVEKQKYIPNSSYSQTDIFDAKTFGELWHESVNGECDDEKEIQIDKSESIAGRIARIACQFTQT